MITAQLGVKPGMASPLFCILSYTRVGNRGDILPGFTSIRAVAKEKPFFSRPARCLFRRKEALLFHDKFFTPPPRVTTNQRPYYQHTISQGLLGALDGSDMSTTQVAWLSLWTGMHRSQFIQLAPHFDLGRISERRASLWFLWFLF